MAHNSYVSLQFLLCGIKIWYLIRWGVPNCDSGTPKFTLRQRELLNDLISSNTCLYVFPKLSFSARKDDRSMPHLARTSSLHKLAVCGVSLLIFNASLTRGSIGWCLNMFWHISCMMSTAVTSLSNITSQHTAQIWTVKYSSGGPLSFKSINEQRFWLIIKTTSLFPKYFS